MMRVSVRLKLAVVAALCAAGLLSASPAYAETTAPQWTVSSVSRPTNFKPGGDKEGDTYVVLVTNTGGAPSSASEAVTITDELPEGLTPAPGVSALDELLANNEGASYNFGKDCTTTGGGNFSCTYSAVVQPDDTLIISFPVAVAASLPDSCGGAQLGVGVLSCVDNVVRVSGGGAPVAQVSTPTSISEAPASFGISPGGASTALSSVQAGGHPDITTSVAFNTQTREGATAGNVKDTITDEPPGFALDLADTPACQAAQFLAGTCPVATQVGITTIDLFPLGPQLEPVYNLAPEPGEVAKIGFSVTNNLFYEGDVSVRPPGEEGEYGGKVTFYNITAGIVNIDNVSLTIWGVPSSLVHNPLRYKPRTNSSTGEIEGFLGVFGNTPSGLPVPFFSNPTSCTSRPLPAAERRHNLAQDEVLGRR